MGEKMIRFAANDDLNALLALDRHISETELLNSTERRRVIVATKSGRIVGWLRYGLFWDNTPFMNMLYVLEEERGKGLGSALVEFREPELRALGYNMALTSTLSDERGQFFYRQHGYRDCGAIVLPNEPAEIIFYKRLKTNE